MLSSARDIASRLVIGPGDEDDVSVYGVPELTQHVRVTSAGNILAWRFTASEREFTEGGRFQ